MLPKNFNKLTNDEQLTIVMKRINFHQNELEKLKKISRKLVTSNVSIKVEEREDDTRLKDTHTKDA